MEIKNLFSDVYLFKPNNHEDERGYFRENFNFKALEERGIKFNSVQDNFSHSKNKGTIRGMHFQKEPFAQAKIIYVIKGKIFDVFIDIRPNSKNFGEFSSIELSEESGFIYIPKGFAHGFCTLKDKTSVLYKVDNYYSKEHESGILWNDEELKINWPFDKNSCLLSEKDESMGSFKSMKGNF